MYYFAYGTNMDLHQMQEQCGKVKIINIARLQDYRLCFTKGGVPAVKREKNSIVFGVLYGIDKECEKNLDRFEGYPTAYRKEEVKVLIGHKDRVKALVYIANEEEGEKAGKIYINRLLKGAREHKLPERYIQEVEKQYGQGTS